MDKLFRDRTTDSSEVMCMLLSPIGILYYVDMKSGIVKWARDMKIRPYQPFQKRTAKWYIDLHDDGGHPHVYNSGVIQEAVIVDDKRQVVAPKGIPQDVVIDRDVDDWTFTKDAGEDNIAVKRIEWTFVGKDWSLRYSVIQLPSITPVSKVFYPRTSNKFSLICNQLGLRYLSTDGRMISAITETKKVFLAYPKKVAAQKKQPGGDGETSYFKGAIEYCCINGVPQYRDAFLKKSNSMSEITRTGQAYAKSLQLQRVVNLLLTERVGHDTYFAFEDYGDSLAAFLQGRPRLGFPEKLNILRGILDAVIELNANFAFHANLAPESILIKYFAPTRRHVVRLCGMTSCVWLSSKQEFENDLENQRIQRQRLARIALCLMTDGKHHFRERDYHVGDRFVYYGEYVNDFKLVNNVTGYFIRKLKSLDDGWTLKMLLKHALFWKESQHLHFLRDFSDRIHLGEYAGIDTLSASVFGRSWYVNTPAFKLWFDEMDAKRKKEKNDDGTPMLGYDDTSFRHLLRFVRNTLNHPTRHKTPGSNKSDLHLFIKQNYPNAFIAAYDHFIQTSWNNDSLKATEFYQEYGPAPDPSRTQ